MNVYPAIKAKMGHPDEGWEYYMVKMKMKDVARNIDFVGDLEVPKSTLEILQRSRDPKRIKGKITPYLQDRPDRFFSSIIVACLGGNATFQPVQLAPSENEVTNELNKEAQDSIGILSLSGGERYYALDGQHRLGAIKEIIKNNDFPSDSGSEFLNEDISVIILRARTKEEAGSSASEQWYRMFRRVFTSLNRYTKPTDADTNILMDDDDIIAITTREMIETFGPFQWDGSVLENAVISLKGKPIKEGKPHLTSLQTLYAMNKVFLSSFDNEETWGNLSTFQQKRPPEKFVNKCTNELQVIWQSLIDAVPDLKKDPKLMRSNEEADDDSNTECNFFFRPNTQEYILAPLIRTMIDNSDLEIKDKVLTKAFQKINKLPSSLFAAPWRHLLLTLNENQRWVMRPAGNDNKPAMELALDLALWITEVTDIDQETEEEYKVKLQSFMPAVSNTRFEELWTDVLNAAK
ncbi:MAG: DNA sulfur modification protein DndB [Pseudomonadota bacterium]|nr:DNA sulfur modification protein DndB [Pseudomonadota bacterium]